MSHPVTVYLLTDTVASLEARGIYARWSTVNQRKLSLNYDQIEAKDGDPLVEACRGLVLRQITGAKGEAGTYEVLALPMRRFYNLGSGHAVPIDWQTARFEEKLDGTLCIVYFDPDLGSFCVATRSVPDADVPNHNGDTFADLFWRHGMLGKRPIGDAWLPIDCTYCFELTGPDNQIVVPYDDWKTTLLASISNNGSGEAAGSADTFAFTNMADAVAWLNTQPGHTLEGFVVRDAAGRRVKIKSSQYLAVSRVMTASGSDSGLVEIVLSGTADDVRGILPKPRQERLDVFAERIREWAHGIERYADELSALSRTDRKAVALAIQASPFAKWMGPLMDLWTGKTGSVSGWLQAGKKNGVIAPSVVDKIAAEVCVDPV